MPASGNQPDARISSHADKPTTRRGIVKNATTKIIGKQPGDMTALREHVT